MITASRIVAEIQTWDLSGDGEFVDGVPIKFALRQLLMEPLHDPLLAACKELLEAPHQEHFAVRLNDEEMTALEKIKAIVKEN